MRCDSQLLVQPLYSRSFNPHTYMRCDLTDLVAQHRPHVSIHTPTWGVTLNVPNISTSLSCFNPHTYMRCDSIKIIILFALFRVSIHTPTWGVTGGYMLGLLEKEVSIHTPTWGVTNWTMRYTIVTIVSIHTPTWGVTTESCWKNGYPVVSIHTPTWGVTPTIQILKMLIGFQSTHLHEVWQG